MHDGESVGITEGCDNNEPGAQGGDAMIRPVGFASKRIMDKHTQQISLDNEASHGLCSRLVSLPLLWRRKRDLNPRAGFPTYSLSRGAPSPLGYFSNGCMVPPQQAKGCWRRGWDSNPRSLAGSLVFKTSSLNHSDTSPCMAGTPIT